MKKTKRAKKKLTGLPQLKKDIIDFLLSEEGKVTEKKIAKVGISLGVLALMARPGDALATGGHGSSPAHTSDFTTVTSPPGGHYSHASHASHGSHSNHSAGGWC